MRIGELHESGLPTQKNDRIHLRCYREDRVHVRLG